jgi:NADP-dependent 3-hydroxy acid dehydrogenase YdfG
MRTVFITGCATGFGHHLAKRLAASGDRVIATDPDLAALDGIRGDHVVRLRLDVTSAEDVRAAALAAGPVDVLVNNAGHAVFGSIEEADLAAVQAMFDVNVLGLARVTQALLPALRASKGTIVQLSSVAGRTVFAESGFYAATKHAVEAMSEALFQEACTFGVKVRVIEPGSFDTMFLPRAIRLSKPRDPSSPYAHLHPTWDARKFTVLEKPQDPALVVDAILAAIEDPAPFRRIPVGPDARRLLGLKDALRPDAWSLFHGERNGLVIDAHADHEVPSPAEVLAAPPDALASAFAALDHGHLGHWDDTELGRAALARLKSIR